MLTKSVQMNTNRPNARILDLKIKPKIINKKINNLFYTGQLTVPGPGVPPSIISGQVVAKHIVESNLN